MISKRLETVASFVPQGAVLLDVGSDHAYLPIELVEKGHIEAAIAGEVVEGPYQSAVTNVESHGLTEKIQVRLANGLAAFEESDQVSVITIAGMGGRLIATILEDGLDKLATVSNLFEIIFSHFQKLYFPLLYHILASNPAPKKTAI